MQIFSTRFAVLLTLAAISFYYFSDEPTYAGKPLYLEDQEDTTYSSNTPTKKHHALPEYKRLHAISPNSAKGGEQRAPSNDSSAKPQPMAVIAAEDKTIEKVDSYSERKKQWLESNLNIPANPNTLKVIKKYNLRAEGTSAKYAEQYKIRIMDLKKGGTVVWHPKDPSDFESLLYSPTDGIHLFQEKKILAAAEEPKGIFCAVEITPRPEEGAPASDYERSISSCKIKDVQYPVSYSDKFAGVKVSFNPEGCTKDKHTLSSVTCYAPAGATNKDGYKKLLLLDLLFNLDTRAYF